MKKNSDKRKEKRFPCLVPVESKKGTSFDSSQTVDISKNGIGFFSPKAVSINQKMALELVWNHESDPVLVVGKVKWARRLPDEEGYRFGMRFEDIIEGSPARLKQYLAK